MNQPIDKSELAFPINRRPRGNPPTDGEAFHMDRLSKMGCLICDAWPVEIHHLLRAVWARWRKDHRCTVQLCDRCHRGQNGLHHIGDERKFFKRHGWLGVKRNVYKWVQEQWCESMRLIDQMEDVA